MRLVQIVADGRPGGGTAVVLDLLSAGRQAGAEVHLLTEPDSYAARQAREMGVTVHEVGFFGKPTTLVGAARQRILRVLRRIDPEVVHIHGNRAAFHAGPLSSHFAASRFHYTVHGYHFEHRSPARRLIGRWAERWATRSLRSWVHVCHYDAELAARHGLRPPAADWRVIENGVDVAALAAHRRANRAGVAFVARLIPQKDPLLAAEILSLLAQRGVPSQVVGDGALGTQFRGRVAAHPEIETLGARSRAEALEALAGAAVLILPSRWEGLPVVILEAMALGVAVVASPVGGVPEVLGSAIPEAGVLIESRDPRAWADEVAALLTDPDRLAAINEEARQVVAHRFDWQRCRDEHLVLYGLLD